MLAHAQVTCATCVRRTKTITLRYREFLLDPGTLFTLVSFLLLVGAVIQNPSGLDEASHASSPLYLAAALVGSVFIWWSAIQGIRERDFTADIPVSLATIAAIAIGQYSAAAVVAVLLLVGGMLEEFVSARAGNALEALAKLLPDRVTVRRDGKDVDLPLDEVRVGDVLLVRSGERVSADGEVISGSASVNQAAITGESVPVEKNVGDSVFAGTLNAVGALEVRVTRVGEETTLGQIRRMVEEAQEQQAPIERLLNRYAKFYTPCALILGAVVWWWSGDLLRSITILIVFCPCVMVLATPTALVASIGNAALLGSLVKKGATVEAMANVDTVAFDKTGTLTFGEPRVVTTVSLNGVAGTDVLRLAAVAEKFSEHPLGRAVVRAAEERGLAIPDTGEFEALPGMGVRARVDGRDLLLGRPHLLVEQGVVVVDEVAARTSELAAAGRTIVAVAVDGQAVGLLVLEDTVRPEAKRAVERLNVLGICTVLVTGDNLATAERIAKEMGIAEVHAEVLPHQKVAIVKGLQGDGRRRDRYGPGRHRRRD